MCIFPFLSSYSWKKTVFLLSKCFWSSITFWISVIPLKILEFVIPSPLKLLEWVISEKCFSNALNIYKTYILPWYLTFPHISQLNSSFRPCNLYNQNGIGLSSQPIGNFNGLKKSKSAIFSVFKFILISFAKGVDSIF